MTSWINLAVLISHERPVPYPWVVGYPSPGTSTILSPLHAADACFSLPSTVEPADYKLSTRAK
jgi:hypothetical protein